MTTLDSDGIRNLRLSRGMSQRQLGNAAGVDIATIRRLERTGLSETSTFSVAQLVRIADHLGVDIGHLFLSGKGDGPARPALEDIQLLGAILIDLGKSTRIRAVRDVLGWDSTKAQAVATALDQTLEPIGMMLSHEKGVFRLGALDDRHQPVCDQIRKHRLARPTQRVVTYSKAKLVYAMERKPTVSHATTDAKRMAIGMLTRAGIVEQDDKGKYIVADQVLRSLYPEGFDRSALATNRAVQRLPTS